MLLLALSCRVVPSPPVDGWPAVALDGVVHVDQKPDFCGEACVEMALRRLGHDVDQDAVFDLTGLDPSLGRGAHTADLVRAVEALGFDMGPSLIGHLSTASRQARASPASRIRRTGMPTSRHFDHPNERAEPPSVADGSRSAR